MVIWIERIPQGLARRRDAPSKLMGCRLADHHGAILPKHLHYECVRVWLMSLVCRRAVACRHVAGVDHILHSDRDALQQTCGSLPIPVIRARCSVESAVFVDFRERPDVDLAALCNARLSATEPDTVRRPAE